LSLTNYNHHDLVITIGIAMFVVYAVKSVVGALIMRVVINFSQQQQVNIRNQLITSYQRMPYSKLIQRNTSQYINKIQLMVPNYANLVMHVLQTVADSIVAVVIICFLAWTNPYAFALLAGIVVFSLVLFDRVIRRRITNAGVVWNTSAAEIVRYTNEALRGFKEIRIFKQERYFKDNLLKNANDLARAECLIIFFGSLPKYIFEMIIISFVVGLSIAIVILVEDPVTLIPTIGVFGIASIRIFPLAKNFSFTMSYIRAVKDTVYKLTEDLLDAPRLNNSRVLTPIVPDIEIDGDVQKIELKSVRYTYPNAATPALNGISLTINSGEHLGIVGTSGAGKTTLVDTLLGLLKPSDGQILVNGHDITEHPQVLWDQVAYLPQEIFIIDGTVRENIMLGSTVGGANESRIKTAIKQAQMEDTLSKLPNGIDTELGENGVNLSGGQRQRIALARAFYFNRRILILDEATSSLDIETETQIINYLKKMKNKLTVISITHRAKSLEHCDRILTIEDGKLREATH
ncbi:MAG: ABC transporter ATP-binding protein, partial [Candidatus Puniceispirillales bacterium WSBS_2018_MAG_OTU23]